MNREANDKIDKFRLFLSKVHQLQVVSLTSVKVLKTLTSPFQFLNLKAKKEKKEGTRKKWLPIN